MRTAKSRLKPELLFGGFTLIELLVVVALIAMIASLLLPALSTAKARSKDVACRNNLRQLQLCWNLYVDDQQGLLPPTSTLQTGADSWISVAPSWAVGDAKHDVVATNLELGVLFPYNRSVGIYRCPGDKTSVVGVPAVPRTRTYQLDEFLNGTYLGQPPLPAGWKKLKFSDLLNPPPTGVLTFIDSHPVTCDSADFTQDLQALGASMDAWGCLPGEQHNRGASLAFADGHLEHWRWRWSRNVSAEIPAYSFANPDDRLDFQRIISVYPKP